MSLWQCLFFATGWDARCADLILCPVANGLVRKSCNEYWPNFVQVMRMPDQRHLCRTEPKGLVSKIGQIFLSSSSDPIECRIVDLSAAGACLEISTLLDFPHRFEFRHGGLRRFCLLAWKRRYRIGIRFEAPRHRSGGGLSRPSSLRYSKFR